MQNAPAYVGAFCIQVRHHATMSILWEWSRGFEVTAGRIHPAARAGERGCAPRMPRPGVGLGPSWFAWAGPQVPRVCGSGMLQRYSKKLLVCRERPCAVPIGRRPISGNASAPTAITILDFALVVCQPSFSGIGLTVGNGFMPFRSGKARYCQVGASCN
jgi:hypothetical protein